MSRLSSVILTSPAGLRVSPAESAVLHERDQGAVSVEEHGSDGIFRHREPPEVRDRREEGAASVWPLGQGEDAGLPVGGRRRQPVAADIEGQVHHARRWSELAGGLGIGLPGRGRAPARPPTPAGDRPG